MIIYPDYQNMIVHGQWTYYTAYSRVQVHTATFVATYISPTLPAGTQLMVVIKNENTLRDLWYSYEISMVPGLVPTSTASAIAWWIILVLILGVIAIGAACIVCIKRLCCSTTKNTGPNYTLVSAVPTAVQVVNSNTAIPMQPVVQVVSSNSTIPIQHVVHKSPATITQVTVKSVTS